MKILQINKFLYPRGGSEEYMFQLSALLRDLGVEYTFWGMSDRKNIVDDEYGCFSRNVDFHALRGAEKIKAAANTVYSASNAGKLGVVLDAFKPDIAHLHNYNYQLTPAILPAIKRRGIRVVYTAHDSQLVCPYHRLYNFRKQQLCEECCGGEFYRCAVNRCFDGSFFKSVLGAAESYFYHGMDYYNKYLDAVISPSHFLAAYLRKRVSVPVQVIPNFTKEYPVAREASLGEYILYFGRVSDEKGLLEIQDSPVWERHRLKIIGDGPDKVRLRPRNNVEYLGPQYGEPLRRFIANARYVLLPSKCYENCPMAVIEAFMCGTPVIASSWGGFRDIIEHGVNGFLIDFQKDIDGSELGKTLGQDPALLREPCRDTYRRHFSPEVHINQIMKVYRSILE